MLENRMLMILCAVVLDCLFGDPPSLPHPVRGMGTLIAREDAFARKRYADSDPLRRRRAMRRFGAGMVLANVLIVSGMVSGLLFLTSPWPVLRFVVEVIMLYSCIAARCLDVEAHKVYRALTTSLAEGRHALSFIVGRETKELSEEDVCKATVETVAENTSDGILAPLFYMFLFGAVGAMAYKMINTMDSMIAYQNEKYGDIGRVAAKMDDVVNWIPARITGVLLCVAGIGRYPVKRAFAILRRDRRRHKSPNCGYPEAAVAGLLGIRLGGSHSYQGLVVEKPTIGDALRPCEREDISRTVGLMYRAEQLFVVLLVAIWLAVSPR